MAGVFSQRSLFPEDEVEANVKKAFAVSKIKKDLAIKVVHNAAGETETVTPELDGIFFFENSNRIVIQYLLAQEYSEGGLCQKRVGNEIVDMTPNELYIARTLGREFKLKARAMLQKAEENRDHRKADDPYEGPRDWVARYCQGLKRCELSDTDVYLMMNKKDFI